MSRCDLVGPLRLPVPTPPVLMYGLVAQLSVRSEHWPGMLDAVEVEHRDSVLEGEDCPRCSFGRAACCFDEGSLPSVALRVWSVAVWIQQGEQAHQ